MVPVSRFSPPPPRDLALLRLCVARQTSVEALWRTWLSLLPPPTGEGAPYPAHWRNLLPLAAWQQRQYQLPGPDWLLSRLRLAAVLEERRLASVHRTTRAILDTPALRDRAPLVIGGLGLGETLYPHPAARHTGLLCLMLRAGTPLRKIRRELLSAGYRVRQAGWDSFHRPFSTWASLWLDHPSGFHLELLSAPFWRVAHRHGHARIYRDASPVDAGEGLCFQTPANAQAWALAGDGLGRDRTADSLLWLVDAVFLARRMGDGAALVESSASARLWDIVNFLEGGER